MKLQRNWSTPTPGHEKPHLRGWCLGKQLQRPTVSFHEAPVVSLTSQEIPCLSPDSAQRLARPSTDIKSKTK